MARPAKWIRDIPRRADAWEAAVRSLQQRMEGVFDYFPLAAEHPEASVENVHQLRVWTRRAGAVLRLYGGLLPSGRAKRLRKDLGRIRRAAADARDDDVLLALLTDEPGPGMGPLIRHVCRHRLAAQRQIQRVYGRLAATGKLKLRLTALVRATRKRARPGRTPRFTVWAARSLQPLVERFFAAAAVDLGDLEALHRFRIRGKRLRYAMELLVAAFPPAFETDLYPPIATLQEKLGAVNDHATAQQRLRRLTDAADAAGAVVLERLDDLEQQALDASLAEFAAWWTPQRMTALRAAFDGLPARPLVRPAGR